MAYQLKSRNFRLRRSNLTDTYHYISMTVTGLPIERCLYLLTLDFTVNVREGTNLRQTRKIQKNSTKRKLAEITN